MTNEIEILVKVRDQATAELAAIAAKARADAQSAGANSGASIAVPVEADASRLEEEVAAETAHVKKDPVEVPVEAADAGEKLRGDVERIGSDVAPDAERTGAGISENLTDGFTRDSQGRLRNTMGRYVSDASREAASAGGIKIPIDVPKDDFEASFRQAMDEGIKASEDADRAMRQSFTSIESGSRSLRSAMAELSPAAQDAGRELENAGNQADSAGKKAANSSGGFDLAKLKMAGLVVGAMTLAPALAAIPAVTAAVTVGVGTMALGFGGVISALKDYGQQSTSSGTSGAQMAQTAFSNAIAIRNAQQAITDAKKQAAQAEQSSADQVYSAQERLQQSTYSLQQSQQSLTDAEQSLTQAQKALTQAQADAANQQIDLNNAAADSSIAVKQAQLQLTEAQENLNKVNGNSASTTDQKTQAQIDLLSATQGLKDAQQRQIESQQAADAANKTGVAGMANVVSAQQGVQKATQGVASAQHGVASAAQAQTDAQTALSRAVQASANQQASSAEAIQKAVQNLSDTYEQQKLAAAAAASAGGGAANKFAQDMAKLTPAGRAFVNEILSMRGGLDQLKATAQNSMLPGFMPLLEGLKGSMPGINGAIGQMGGVIGGVATQFGNLLQSPVFRGELKTIFGDGLKFAQQFGDGFVKMVDGVTGAVSKAGPIVAGLGGGLSGLMSSGLPAFFQGLVTNAPGAGQALSSLLGAVSDLLGPLGTLAGAAAGALGPVFAALRPVVSQLAGVLVQTLVPVFNNLSPLLVLIARLIGALMPIITPIIKIAGQLADTFLKQLVPALTPLIPIIQQAATTIGQALMNALIQLMPSINQMIKAFIQLLPALLPLIPPLAQLIAAIIQLTVPTLKSQIQMITFIELALKPLAEAVGWLGKTMLPLLTGAINLTIGPLKALGDAAGAGVTWVQNHMDGMIKWIRGVPGKLASAGAGMWDWLSSSFKSVLNMIIGWWDDLSFTTPHFHIPGIGDTPSVTIGMPYIQPFAAGGVLPGGITSVIGEKGWEPLRLPDGTVAIPHANARQAIAAGAMGGGGGPLEVRVSFDNTGGGDELIAWLRKRIRITAGNGTNSVQRALGQAV